MMTINIRRAHVVAIVTGLLIAGALAFGSYSYGESTRMADVDVHELVRERMTSAVDKRSAEAVRDEAAAVEAAVTETKRVARRKMKRAVKRSFDRGYESGNEAGYSAGNSAGYSAGSADGVEQGIDEATDELVCSDDSDVDLPACWWW